MNFITYILYSQSLSKYYTGHTQDLQKRLQEHNAGQTASIKNGIPWKIVWTAELSLRSNAMSLETKIKKRGAARFLADLNKM